MLPTFDKDHSIYFGFLVQAASIALSA